jgi:hypothetical protein
MFGCENHITFKDTQAFQFVISFNLEDREAELAQIRLKCFEKEDFFHNKKKSKGYATFSILTPTKRPYLGS